MHIAPADLIPLAFIVGVPATIITLAVGDYLNRKNK